MSNATKFGPQSFTFTATDASTVLNFQGYNVPSSTTLVNLFFGTTGSTVNASNNLLVGARLHANGIRLWQFLRRRSEHRSQSYGANGLYFGGTCAGIFDTLSTSLNTTIGQAYTLRFDLAMFGNSGNGTRVSTGASQKLVRSQNRPRGP